MISSNITFDSLDFTFDPTQIEVSAGAISLLNLTPLSTPSYSTQNPSVEFNGFIEFSSLISLAFNAVVGEVYYIFLKNGVPMYYFQGAWIESDGTFAQSNLWTDYGSSPLTVIQSLYSPGDYFSFILFFHSDSTYVSGVSSVSISYQAENAISVPALTQVIGSIRNILLKNIPDDDITLSVQLYGPVGSAGSYIVLNDIPINIPVVSGNFSVYLANTDDMGLGYYYLWTLNGNVIKRQVPAIGSVSFLDLPTAF